MQGSRPVAVRRQAFFGPNSTTRSCGRKRVSDATRTICSHFCSHNIPKQDETGASTLHHQKTWNYRLPNAFPERSEGYRSWPCCTHNPKVAGSNPAPATKEIKGLADAPASLLVVLGVFWPCSRG